MGAEVKIKDIKIKASKTKSLGQFAGLPSAFKTPDKGLLNKQAIHDKLEGLKRFEPRLLSEAASLLSQLNRFNLKSDKRLDLVKTIVSQAYAVMARRYQKYQTKVLSLPESREQRECLIACVTIAEQAAIAFKQYFKSIYSSKSVVYRRFRSECIEVSVRILELLRIEQRFRALRHQKLPPSNWQDINRVFFSMLLHKDVDEPVKLLGHIGTWARTAKAGVSAIPTTSARSLYVSIQLFGLVDAPSWSTRLFHAPDAYLALVPNAVNFHPDSKKELEPGWLITHIDSRQPPQFQRDPHMPEPRLLLEYANLYNRLIKDYEELAKMKFLGEFDLEKLSRPLLDLEQIERLPFLESMLFGLRPRERKQKRRAAFGNEKLKIYFGFKDTYRLLMDLADDDVKRITKTRAFSDSLAMSSSFMADDAKGYKNAHWEIVNFSTGGILVLTKESSFTNPIQIGQIVAFNPNPDVKRPLLGYVSRINRPNDQQVEVAIVRFSNHAEAAIVRNEQHEGSINGEAVLVFKSMEGRWCLIATHDYDFVSGMPFKLLRENNQTIPARLGNVMLTKQEFIVFELSAPGL